MTQVQFAEEHNAVVVCRSKGRLCLPKSMSESPPSSSFPQTMEEIRDYLYHGWREHNNVQIHVKPGQLARLGAEEKKPLECTHE